MIAIILIAVLTLIGAVFTIYVWQRSPSDERADSVLPAAQFKGLFDRPGAAQLGEENQETKACRERKLLERASSGDLNALVEADSTRDTVLYSDVLSALVTSASQRQESLAALVSHVSKSNQLRANKQLAQRLIETWKTAPDRRSTTEMIHIAALSDDAETYERAIDAALDLWRRGRLAQFSAEELIELFVSQYWVIAPETRRGGVGFALKRRLLGIRRELATTTPAR
jgi:hypothetical protein